jgi:PBP1b-binding outer membrane lipoprotein LpoB
MRYRWLVGTLLLLPACSQHYPAPSSVQTSAAPDAAFDCVKRQLPILEYKQSSIDVAEHRITAQRYDTEARRADVQFRRVIHRMEIEVGANAGGQTSIDVKSHTFAEYTTQRGPTEVEEKASAEVKEDAEKLLKACRG